MFTKRSERVAEEVDALSMARHPGVVDLVDAADGALRTRMVDGRPVGELPPLAAGEVAGLAAAVATTLADLHDLGVVHGGIDATHVLVTPDGRPVLCSLGRGGHPADDMAALGRLVTALLESALPEDRLRWRGGHRLRQRQPGGRVRLGPMLAPPAGPALAALAGEATAVNRAARPTARAFADAIGRLIPDARLPQPGSAPPVPIVPPSSTVTMVTAPAPGFGPPASPGLARLRPTALVALLTVVTVAGGWALARPSSPPATSPTGRRAADSAMTVVAPAAVSTTPVGTTPAATRVWPADPLELANGVVTYRGARYALGQSGDAIVAADWRCTGLPTLAVLRRNAGQIFAFDGWPDAGGAMTARPVGQVEGASGMRVVDADADGCPELEVERTGAPPVRLRVAP